MVSIKVSIIIEVFIIKPMLITIVVDLSMLIKLIMN